MLPCWTNQRSITFAPVYVIYSLDMRSTPTMIVLKFETPAKLQADNGGPMITSIKRFNFFGCVIVAAVVMEGCSGCDLVGCVSGLRVRLASLPSTPFQIELLVDGAIQTAPPEATCNGDRVCFQDVVFDTQAADQVTIRVTTPSGVRTTQFAHITYSKFFPNGKRCGGECHSSDVTAQIP